MSNQQYSTQIPNREALAGNNDGTITEVWYQFFTFLASLTATEFEPQTVGSSPYVFQASKLGHLHVAASAATTSVVLQRGGVSLACPTSGFVPVVAGDEVTVTFNAAVDFPGACTFVPGART